MSIDSLLGRDYLFHDGSTVHALVTIVAWCPDRGWKLAGRGFTSAWVEQGMFRRLLKEGVLCPN